MYQGYIWSMDWTFIHTLVAETEDLVAKLNLLKLEMGIKLYIAPL